jgi:CheY-like chemotaxis protein
LSQVYGIAKQSGGAVSIATRIGEGTTVTVYLPRTNELPIAPSSEESKRAPLPSHDATILVVDDDTEVRQFTVSCLESLGYRVLAADGGRAAIEIADSGAMIDLVLIDVAMPEITGVEVMDTLLKKRPALPFLYMTGYVGHTKLDPSEQHILKKPFTISELASKLEETLLSGEAEPRGREVVPLKVP